MRRELADAVGFLRDLLRRLEKGDIFFMSGAITFNVVVAVIPLLLFVAGMAGYFLSARFDDPAGEIIRLVLSYLPEVQGDLELAQAVGGILENLIEERAGFSIVGGAFLLWISTRLVGTIRTVLRDAFDLQHDRGMVRGKLFDLHVVLLGGFFLLLNMGVTIVARAVEAFDVDPAFLSPTLVGFFQGAVRPLVSIASAWILFHLLYWYLPARRIPFRTAAVGATFTAVTFEVMKEAFAWYTTSVADYSTAYGNMAVVAVLFFWLYYSAVVFTVGAHVARVYEARREVRMQAATLPQGLSNGG